MLLRFPESARPESKKANPFREGVWVCASGACDYFSDRKDGVPSKDAKMLLDFDDFYPNLLVRIPRYY
jgi:hypothetical protein